MKIPEKIEKRPDGTLYGHEAKINEIISFLQSREEEPAQGENTNPHCKKGHENVAQCIMQECPMSTPQHKEMEDARLLFKLVTLIPDKKGKDLIEVRDFIKSELHTAKKEIVEEILSLSQSDVTAGVNGSKPRIGMAYILEEKLKILAKSKGLLD